MKIMHDTQSRRFKDPSALTDYERGLVELKKQGLTHKQIGK